MVDYQAVKNYFNTQSLPYFTFFPKSLKPIKAVIRHLPHNTPAEDMAEGLGDIGFDVISVKQMSSVRRSPEGPTNITLPLFLVTLPRTTKSSEIFQLSSLCHISIKVEAYKSQNNLTQCFNCQKFGHVWANCKQPPPPLLVVRGRPPAQGLPGEGEHIFDPGVLQLSAFGRRKSSPRQLPRLQARQGRDAQKETPGNAQNHVWQGVLLQPG
jgi:hypothetical protein